MPTTITDNDDYRQEFQFSKDAQAPDTRDESVSGGAVSHPPADIEPVDVRGGIPVFFDQTRLFVPGGLYLGLAHRNHALVRQYADAANELAQMFRGGNPVDLVGENDGDGDGDGDALQVTVPDSEVVPNDMYADLVRAASVPTPDELLVATRAPWSEVHTQRKRVKSGRKSTRKS